MDDWTPYKEEYEGRIAVIDEDGRSYTYGELDGRRQALSNAVGGRCLVFLLCTNSVGSLVGYTACLRHGIVALALDGSIDEGVLDSLACAYSPRYVWMPEGRKAPMHCATVLHMDGYKLVQWERESVYALHKDLALLLMTSGSTGSKKLVRQSYGNIRANTEAIIQCLGIDGEHRAVTTLPMSYTYGLSIINTHLHVGGSILVTSQKVVGKRFWEMMRKYGVTSLAGVPLTYEMLWKMNFGRMELPDLRILTQAGGRLPVEVHRYFAEYANRTGRRFYVMYGQTEATARISCLPYGESARKVGSVGVPIPRGRWWLVDEDGERVEGRRQTGEIVYAGGNVAMGYANRGEDLAKGDEWRGVLHTGDIGYLDEEGYCYITGRRDRYCKIYGNRINLDEVEEMARVRTGGQMACIGRDGGIRLFAEEGVDGADVVGFLSAKIRLPKSVISVGRVGRIPRTGSGKVDYNVLAGMPKEEKGK